MTTKTGQDWRPFSRVRDLAIAMTEIRSVTGSTDEADFADQLLPLIRAIPYFADHPDHVMVFDSHGEPRRKNIALLVKGQGARTLAFCGHYDTVSTANYLELQSLATQPELLLDALMADLSTRTLSDGEAKALTDFRSGDFLPGRGLLDMKSGDAAGLAVLQHWAERGDLDGNLLLMLNPDEEGGSAGVRAMRHDLPAVAERFGLQIEAAINLDATSDQGNGETGRAIYRGSIGKFLPFAFVLGRAAHAAYPFEGISAHLIAAGLIRSIEANPDLADRAGDEICPPPVCLGLRDDREAYDVTIPDRVFMAFNWLSANWTASTLLDRFNMICKASLDETLSRYATMAGPGHEVTQSGRVIAFAELKSLASGKMSAGTMESLARDHAANPNPIEASRLMVAELMNAAGLEGPVVITGLASLHYPAVHLDRAGAGAGDLVGAIDAARQAMADCGEPSIIWRDWFMGISDMSFLGHQPEAGEKVVLSANTALPHLVDQPPANMARFPVVNIGPWGREYHQRLERVHAPYAFDQLPRFLSSIVEAYFRR